jgi:ketosteroid isomerase-like protein
MSEHPSAARYRQIVAAINAGDFATFSDSLADDVVWWEIGASEPVHGRNAVVERLSFVSDFDVSIDLHDVTTSDDHLIALLAVTATGGDETFKYRTAEIQHLNDAGEITERWSFSDDTQAVMDFFS